MSTAKAEARPPLPKGAERRVHERVDLELEVGFESEHNFYTGLTQDISQGGLFVATHNIRPVGTIIPLQFKLPGLDQPITLEGEVRWIRETSSLHRADGPHGMGLRFINLTEAQKQAITRFLEQRDSLFYDDE